MPKKHENQTKTINAIAEKILANDNIEQTTVSILNNMKSELNAFAGVIFLFDEKQSNIYAFAHTTDRAVMQATKLLGRDPFTIKFPIHATEHLVIQTFLNNKITISSRLADFFSPTINAKTLNIIQKLLRVKVCVGIPVRIKQKPVGVLFITFQREELAETDEEIIQLYANLSGIALENNKNIQKLQHQYEAEKETAAMLTHELKTPISIAHNSSELLSLTIKKYENIFPEDFISRLREQQLEIHESILRMNRICNSIFSLTEVENSLSEENQRLNLSMSLSHLINMYQKFKSKKIELVYHEKIHDGVLYGGGIQFEQVISILLENAFKYTTEGEISVDLEVTPQYMRCSITDTGPGIAKNQKTQIFERFFRIKNKPNQEKKHGLGLGLYIAQKITEKLKGSIKIEDNPRKKGSRFTVEFPVYSSLENEDLP